MLINPPTALNTGLSGVSGRARTSRAGSFWNGLWSLGLALALGSNTALGAPADQPEVTTSGAGERLVFEAKQESEGFDIRAIMSGQDTLQRHVRLSADIFKAPFRKALKVFARETGIKVLAAQGVPDDTISVQFDELPLDEALKRLLKGRNYMLTYGKPALSEDQHLAAPKEGHKETRAREGGSETEQNSPGTQQITEVRILSPGSTANRANETMREIKVDPDEQALEIEALVRKAQEGATPQERLAAIEEFQHLAEDKDIPAIAPVLHDEDQRVRRSALETLQNLSSGEPPVDELAEVARRDPTPQLRMQALEVLIEFRAGEAAKYIQEALQDANADVRRHAKRMQHMNDKLAEYQARFADEMGLQEFPPE